MDGGHNRNLWNEEKNIFHVITRPPHQQVVLSQSVTTSLANRPYYLLGICGGHVICFFWVAHAWFWLQLSFWTDGVATPGLRPYLLSYWLLVPPTHRLHPAVLSLSSPPWSNMISSGGGTGRSSLSRPIRCWQVLGAVGRALRRLQPLTGRGGQERGWGH